MDINKIIAGAIGIVICLAFIISRLNKEICNRNVLLEKNNEELADMNEQIIRDNQLLVRTIKFIYSQLKLTKMKDCPDEEKNVIVTEVCDFIKEIGVVNDKV